MTTHCRKCDGIRSRVTDSRPYEGVTRRRRECKSCHARWTTYELTVPDFEHDEFRVPLDIMDELAGLDRDNRYIAREVIRGLVTRQAATKIRRVA